MQEAQQPGNQALKYRDVEGCLYHYPQAYFSKLSGYELFLYYRPSRGASRTEASCYVGFGRLGEVFDDYRDRTHRYVRVLSYRRFARPVPYADPTGSLYETSYSRSGAFQGNSVRGISQLDFLRILQAGGEVGDALSKLDSSDPVEYPSMLLTDRLPRTMPTQRLRIITEIPDGAGYVPSENEPVDRYDSASLQERARRDHQLTLRSLQELSSSKGATTYYDNHIDLYVELGEERVLIEAKSINLESATVDRMRYGMGQLFDYRVRYKAQIAEAVPLLAFGKIPSFETGWISDVLQQNDVAFAALDERQRIVPLNRRARDLTLFS